MESTPTGRLEELARRREILEDALEGAYLEPSAEQARQELPGVLAEMKEIQAEQAAAWPELHPPAGDADHPVDLTPLWNRLAAGPMAGTRVDDPIDSLAEYGGGLARRLRAGISSLRQRRDGNTGVHLDADSDADTITVTAWSRGGCWTGRAWWIQGTIHVKMDRHGEVRLTCPEVTMLVMGETGAHTTYVDRADVLGWALCAWYMAWAGRRRIRSTLGYETFVHKTPLTLEEFLR